MTRARILIVGGGIAGLSTAWHLARRGARGVVLLERERTLATHSSGRNAAILRTLAADPAIAALGAEGAAFLHRPPEGFGDGPLVDSCGLVLAAEPEAERALAKLLRLAPSGVAVEEVSGKELARLAPHLAGPARSALHVPSDGRIDIALLARGFERGAREGGVEIRSGERVEALLLRSGAVLGARLASGEELRAGVTAIAAGGWADGLGLLAGSRVRLRAMRRHLAVTAPEPRVEPSWPVVWVLGRELYARPESGGLLLCACDEIEVDPERCERDPRALEEIARRTALHLPAFADAPVAHWWCGVRTFADDRRFAVGRDPDVAGLFWIAGLGGHGMVCAAPVGALAADLLLEGASARPAAAALDPARLVRPAARARG